MAANEQPRKPWEIALHYWKEVAGAIATILGLVFIFFPGLRPSLPPDPDVKINTIAVERDVDFETYLHRHNLSASSELTCVELKSNGFLLKPTIELTGFKGQSVQLNWSMYNADTERLVPSEWYPDDVFLPQPTYIPKRQKDIWVFEHWIPYPNAQGEFFARLELFKEERGEVTSLGFADTKPFSVWLLPECAGPPPNVPFPPDVQNPEWAPPP